MQHFKWINFDALIFNMNIIIYYLHVIIIYAQGFICQLCFVCNYLALTPGSFALVQFRKFSYAFAIILALSPESIALVQFRKFSKIIWGYYILLCFCLYYFGCQISRDHCPGIIWEILQCLCFIALTSLLT